MVFMDFKKFVQDNLGDYSDIIWTKVFTEKELSWKSGRKAVNRAPIWNWIVRNNPSKILEIGLGNGFNAYGMTSLAEECTYYCFDNLERSDSKEAYDYFSKRENFFFYIGDTKKILANKIDNLPKMDLIFIDGGHSYEECKNDWNGCKNLIHDKTTVWFHDYGWLKGVRKTVEEISNEYTKKIINPKLGPSFALIEKI